jgi:hypothetical protein
MKKARTHFRVRAFQNYPGSDLLSRKLDRHYHRPCSVSRPCSVWERVGPLRQDHRETGLVTGDL